MKQKNISYNNLHLIEDCKNLPLQILIFNYLFCSSFNIKNEIYKNFKDLIFQPKLNVKYILQIRKLSSKIKELDIPYENMIQQIIMSLTEEDNYMKIIKVCNDYNYKKINSYRELIHIESLIIHLNLIINNIYNHGLL